MTDDPGMTRRRSDESGPSFAARLAMLDRLTPVLQALTAEGFSLLIESQRRGERLSALASDAVLELGDLRLRVILRAGESGVVLTPDLVDELQHYLLDVPDTDAIAIVADDDDLTTWLVDVYDVNGDWHARSGSPLQHAISSFRDRNVTGIGVPQIRDKVVLPSRDELAALLARTVRAHLEQIRTAKVRIPEKVAALSTIAPDDSARLVAILALALEGEPIDLGSLLANEDRLTE